MPSEACFSQPRMSFQQASHVIPAEACAMEWNLWEAAQKAKDLDGRPKKA